MSVWHLGVPLPDHSLLQSVRNGHRWLEAVNQEGAAVGDQLGGGLGYRVHGGDQRVVGKHLDKKDV